MPRQLGTQVDLPRFGFGRWAAIIATVVCGSVAFMAILRLNDPSWTWYLRAIPLLILVGVAGGILYRLIHLPRILNDGPVVFPEAVVNVAAIDQVQSRVDVFDPVGVQAAFADGLLPVLRGHRKVVVFGGVIEVRDSASVELHGTARATLYDNAGAKAMDSAVVELHDQAWCVAEGEVMVAAHDRSTVEASGPLVEVVADGVSRVVADRSRVFARGRATVVVAGSGHCQARQEAVVVLENGVVEATDDSRVLTNPAAGGVVRASDQVVIQHRPGVRVISDSAEVHVVSEDEPALFDIGPATWFPMTKTTHPTTWARAWRIPVIAGHMALTIDISEGRPPVSVDLTPVLPERRDAIALSKPTRATPTWYPPENESEDETYPDNRLVAWVPLSAVRISGTEPGVTVNAVLAAGAAWLDRYDRPTTAPDMITVTEAESTASIGGFLDEHFSLPKPYFSTLNLGRPLALGAGWQVRVLPAAIDPDALPTMIPASWEVLSAEQTPIRKMVLLDRSRRQIFIDGPPNPPSRGPVTWLVVAVLFATIAAVVSMDRHTPTLASLGWSFAGTAVFALGVLGCLYSRRLSWYRARWWSKLAQERTIPIGLAPNGSASNKLVGNRSSVSKRVSAPKTPIVRRSIVPGTWTWIGLIVGCAVAAFCCAGTVAGYLAGNLNAAVVDAIVGLVGLAIAIIPWRPRRETPIDGALPLLGRGKHQISFGSHLAGPGADVEAVRAAQLVLTKDARATMHEYAHLNQLDGSAVLTDYATAVVYDGEIRCEGKSVVLLRGGVVHASGEATVLTFSDTEAEINIDGNQVTVVRLANNSFDQVPPATTTELLDQLAIAGYQQQDATILWRNGKELATVIGVDQPLDPKRVQPLPRLAHWQQGKPGGDTRLWLPGLGLLVEHRTRTRSRARWLMWLPVLAVGAGLIATTIAAPNGTPTTIVLMGVFAATMAAAIVVWAIPWWLLLRRRLAALRAN